MQNGYSLLSGAESRVTLKAHFKLWRASHQLQIKKEKINNELKTRKVTKYIYSFGNI